VDTKFVTVGCDAADHLPDPQPGERWGHKDGDIFLIVSRSPEEVWIRRRRSIWPWAYAVSPLHLRADDDGENLMSDPERIAGIKAGDRVWVGGTILPRSQGIRTVFQG